jgi:hypothetical protein
VLVEVGWKPLCGEMVDVREAIWSVSRPAFSNKY